MVLGSDFDADGVQRGPFGRGSRKSTTEALPSLIRDDEPARPGGALGAVEFETRRTRSADAGAIDLDERPGGLAGQPPDPVDRRGGVGLGHDRALQRSLAARAP